MNQLSRLQTVNQQFAFFVTVTFFSSSAESLCIKSNGKIPTLSIAKIPLPNNSLVFLGTQ